MTPGVTSAPFSEAMPAHPQNGDEVIAVNLGSSVYTLTGSITGGNVALDAGETAILVYAGSTAGWYVTWRSATGAVSYPISVDHGGTGIDGTGVLLFAATGTAAKFSSPDGISLLAQTSATDGSNANPTQVVKTNTGQVSDAVQFQTTSGAPSFRFFVNEADTVALGRTAVFSMPIFDDGGGNTLAAVIDTTSIADAIIIGGQFTGGVGIPQRSLQLQAFDPNGGSQNQITLSGSDSSVTFTLSDGGSLLFYSTAILPNAFPTPSNVMDLGDGTHKFKDGYFGGTVDAAAYKVGGAAGGSASVTTASLVGKTMTFVNGLFTGIA